MNWLDEVIKQHAELESPESFWKWSAIAAISAVLKDNVWIDRGGAFNTYPNIYVMLHADSGLKKGPPVNMAKRLVTMVNNTRVITGRSSVQAILKDMGTATSGPGGKTNSKSVVFICSSELTSSLVSDPVATKILTDLYDRQYNEGEWRSLLKLETFSLRDPTVSMLTATNEAMSSEFFDKSTIQGGFYARTFVIYEKEGTIDNSLIYPLEYKIDLAGLASYLKELALLRGPFKPFAMLEESHEYRFKKIKKSRIGTREIWFNGPGVIYDDWYETFKKMVREQDIKDDTGTLNRFGDSVIKVAMLLSLAERPILEITEDAMNLAIKECEKLVGNARRTTMGKTGMSTQSQLKTALIMELLNRESHAISRQLLMKKMWMHYSTSEELDELLLSFHNSGIILTESVGSQIVYRMPDSEVEEYKNFMAGRNKK